MYKLTVKSMNSTFKEYTIVGAFRYLYDYTIIISDWSIYCVITSI